VTDLLPLLQEFHRDKLTTLLRHQEHARLVAAYDANNTYQYIINRDEVQLSWVASAIADLGATPDGVAPPAPPAPGKKAAGAAERAAIEADGHEAQAFVDRWRSRVETMTNARHRGMLRVILGETLEQKRSFEQALAGRTDMIGRRNESAGPAKGKVLPGRWVE
jgi:hypothetical protein